MQLPQNFRLYCLAICVFVPVCSITGIAADKSGIYDTIMRGQVTRPARAALAPAPFMAASFTSDALAPKRPARQAQRRAGTAVADMAQSRTYCVRLSDGYYYSLGFVDNKTTLAKSAAMCRASCEGQTMALFTQPVAAPDGGFVALKPEDTILQAVDNVGRTYAALPAAFAYRRHAAGAFSCRAGQDHPRIAPAIDMTLKQGDILVMDDGLKVFHGKPERPHVAADFVSITAPKSLPKAVRRKVLALETRILK